MVQLLVKWPQSSKHWVIHPGTVSHMSFVYIYIQCRFIHPALKQTYLQWLCGPYHLETTFDFLPNSLIVYDFSGNVFEASLSMINNPVLRYSRYKNQHECSSYSDSGPVQFTKRMKTKVLHTVSPIKYTHGRHVFYFLSIIPLSFFDPFNPFTLISQGCCTGTGATVWLPQRQWSCPDEYGWTRDKLEHYLTTQTKRKPCACFWRCTAYRWINAK